MESGHVGKGSELCDFQVGTKVDGYNERKALFDTNTCGISVKLPIVAIGASAGGLEAISGLLAAVPSTNTMSYVLIPHLDREHRSLMAELLAKRTTMPVQQERPLPVRFGILVSDIGLSGTDGYELVRRIRDDLKLTAEQLPMIAVTAFGRDDDRRRALRASFQAHLAKPFEATQLIALVSQLARRVAP